MEITKDPNNILHQKLNIVKEITPAIKTLINAMRQEMIAANGVGLAANQVGSNWRIFVIDRNLAAEHSVPDAYINPELTEYSKDTAEMEEGCLSIPDFWPQLRRAKKVKLKALDENGIRLKIKARGFLARVFQHETDHLNGILIKNRV